MNMFSPFVRFRMQVMLNGRLFPVAEASSKKVAKKDAAAATLRILYSEMQGGASTGDNGNAETTVKVMDIQPETPVSCRYPVFTFMFQSQTFWNFDCFTPLFILFTNVL